MAPLPILIYSHKNCIKNRPGVKRLLTDVALATSIGDTFLYGKRKESQGEAGKARDARAA
jgi:hypothetical protein